jgi:hypothetical protein
VPEFVVQDSREGQINLNTSEWLILSKIDGQRSIKGIAAAGGLSVFDASKILYGLVATGLIRLREGPPAVPSAPGPRASVPQEPAPGSSAASQELLAKLTRVRDVCNAQLGNVGESVVNKHYLKAKAEIEKGAGAEAVDEAISQIARAASILKGPSTTESLLDQLKAVR